MSPAASQRPNVRWRRRLERLVAFGRHDIWQVELGTLPKALAWLTRSARVLLITVRGCFRDRCLQQAAALTYSTIFALPSVLAFAFAAAKGFNVYGRLKVEAIEPFLDRTFGARASGAASEMRAAVDQIFAYVESSDLSALGSLALVFVVYTVLRLLGAVEGSLNDIYGVKRARTWLRRVSDYLAIVVVAPIVLLVALTLTAFLKSTGSDILSNETVRSVVGGDEAVSSLKLAGKILPLFVVWFGFSFVYLTLPNTRVRISSALLGGVVAGTIWQGVQILHLDGQIELARYNRIYSSFAAIPMLLLWIYLSWAVFLVGAELAFAHQNEPMFTSMARTGKVDQDYRERVALRLAGRCAHAFLRGHRPPTTAELAGELGVAPRTVAQVLDALVGAGLLVRASVGLDDGYLPARDPGSIRVLDLVRALRHEEGASQPPVRGRLDERADRLLAALAEENAGSPANDTLVELARTLAEAPAALVPEGGAGVRAEERPA